MQQVQAVASARAIAIKVDVLFVVVGVHHHRKNDLADVGLSFDAVGAFLGLLERWKQYCDQDRYDGNDHKQFDEGESTFATHKRAPWQRLAHILIGMCSLRNVSRVKS